MESKVLIVCISEVFLGILAAILGFAAEGTRIKASDIMVDEFDNCTYPNSPAFGLGLTAFLVLLIAQITITVLAGCGCCKRNPNPNSNLTLPRLLSVFSWLTFIVASSLLLRASVVNIQHTEEIIGSFIFCSYTKPMLFGGGAILSIVCVTLSIGYYYLMSTSSSSKMDHFSGRNQGGIPTVQPGVPPQMAQPTGQQQMAAQPPV